MTETAKDQAFSANEASCITGVPLKQVHRIIDAGLLDRSEHDRKHSRTVRSHELQSLALAYEITGLLTHKGRERLVRKLLDHPDADSVRERCFSVDLASIRQKVLQGSLRLKIACKNVSLDPAVLAGTPCIKGTRIPVHDIADMLSNGDSVQAIAQAFPRLSHQDIEHAELYALAYPRRGRPRRTPLWRGQQQGPSITTTGITASSGPKPSAGAGGAGSRRAARRRV